VNRSEAFRALLFVAAYRARHGYGPTWRELRQAMSWGYREGNVKIRALREHGLRWRSGVERSLDVEPAARRRLLAALRGGAAVGGEVAE
jgi:hypothetical protein